MRLVLFFTRDVSLAEWDRIGMFDREVALYRRLAAEGVESSFITYGGREDLLLQKKLPEVEICCNRHHLPQRLYRRLIPYLHHSALRRCDAIKTNQTQGAEIALRAARLWQKPLIARCGFMWSEFVQRESGNNAALAAAAIEERVFRSADRVVVTTSQMRTDIVQRTGVEASLVRIHPNYVDTNQFRPTDHSPDADVTFIGRLHPQKNLQSLLEAVRSLNLSAKIIGTGPLSSQLRQQFRDLDQRVRWLGNLSHSQLPGELGRSRLFVLPSHYEGHPKTLIEAMACGCAVIGADSPGIREVIQHERTGLLCPPDAESLSSCIATLIHDASLRTRLGRAARTYAVNEYGLGRIVEMERDLLKEVVPDDSISQKCAWDPDLTVRSLPADSTPAARAC